MISEEHFREAQKAGEYMAQLVWTYFSQLVVEGFDPDKALALTLAYQRSMLDLRPSKDG